MIMAQVDADPRALEFLQSDLKATVPIMNGVMEEDRRQIEQAKQEIAQKVEEAIQEEQAAEAAVHVAEQRLTQSKDNLSTAKEQLSSAQDDLAAAYEIPDDPEDENGNGGGSSTRDAAVARAEAAVAAAEVRVSECEEMVQQCEQALDMAKAQHEMAIAWMEATYARQQQFESEANYYLAAAQASFDEYQEAIQSNVAKLEEYRLALLETQRYLSGADNIYDGTHAYSDGPYWSGVEHTPPPLPPEDNPPLRVDAMLNERPNYSGAYHAIPPNPPSSSSTPSTSGGGGLTPVQIAIFRRRADGARQRERQREL
jgi:hypothetical protein